MYTGFWMDRWITTTSPTDSGRFWIQDGYIWEPRESGRFWIECDHVYWPHARVPWAQEAH
jgi:hypothetical protein